MPLVLHRLVLSQGQTPVHPGSIQWGNVNWFRHFSHRAFEADAGYPVRHALTMYHHIIEREAAGQSIAPHLGFDCDKVLADLKSMRGELEKYIQWIDEVSGSR
jgi:hypothetical protein